MSTLFERMQQRAGEFAGVDQGTACTQMSFKVGKTAFLFLGEQGGRNKAMIKLRGSRDAAIALAKTHPKDVQVGKGDWVTLRFDDEAPHLEPHWEAWLRESQELCQP